MVCPKCSNQLIQASYEMEPLGNGYGTDSEYLTWEIKRCRGCNSYYLEQYSALELSLERVEQIAKEHINLRLRIGQSATNLVIMTERKK